ncbi:MAG: hypothetical protein ACOWWH_01110 [Eubacteriaceae bacterium]
MVQVLLVSNNNDEDVKKVKDTIEEVGVDYFVDANVIIKTEEQIDSCIANSDFVVSLIPYLDVDDKKVIDATPIIKGRFQEKTEKDILNQLLRHKVRGHKNV